MRKIIMKGLASIYTDVPTLRPGTIEAYALAFVSAGVATVMRSPSIHMSWALSALHSFPRS
jgi:hypothetical protein